MSIIREENETEDEYMERIRVAVEKSLHEHIGILRGRYSEYDKKWHPKYYIDFVSTVRVTRSSY